MQLAALNAITFSDTEWDRFFNVRIGGRNDGDPRKDRSYPGSPCPRLGLDDGSTKNVRLIDKANVHNNRLQVINQYEV